MLTLLRRIRKSLIESGATRKYLLYAVGEILLVMIGILLALQVNNWNEWKKERVKESNYLKNLRKELIDNEDVIQRGIYFHNLQMEQAQLLLNLPNHKKDSLDIAQLHFAVVHLGWAWNVDFVHDVWDDLINTGNKDLILNHTLTDSISYFYALCKDIKRNQDEWSGFNIRYRQITGAVLPPSLRISVADGISYPGFRAKFKYTDNMKMLSSDEISNSLSQIEGIGPLLADIYIIRKTGTILFDQGLDIISDLLRQIDREL